MTKLDFCSIQTDEKLIKTDENGKSFEMFYRPKMFRLDPVNADNIQDRITELKFKVLEPRLIWDHCIKSSLKWKQNRNYF